MKHLLCAAAAATLFGTGAQALTVSFDTTFGPASVGSADFVVQLPQFDPSLGTLLGVELTLDASTSAGTIAWDNEADSSSDVTLGIGAEVMATAPSALAVTAVPLQVGSDNVDADNDGAADFLGSDAFSVVGGTGTDSDSASLTNPPDDLSAYIGLGNFDTTIGNSVETFLSTSGGFGPIQPTPGQFEGTLTVTYEYIPEPASLSLLSLGAVAMLRRRR